jgi:hypothetical protein
MPDVEDSIIVDIGAVDPKENPTIEAPKEDTITVDTGDIRPEQVS